MLHHRQSTKSILVDKNILLNKPSSLDYILSEGGGAFFHEILLDYQNG